MQQQVFYTHDRAVMLSIRHKQPIFLLDAEAQQLHGVFQRTLDERVLQQDLTQAPGPRGFEVNVNDHLLQAQLPRYPSCLPCT